MSRSRGLRTRVRRFLLIGVAGILPAFVMRCDKAALNLQEGFFEGLGAALGTSVVDADFSTFGGA